MLPRTSVDMLHIHTFFFQLVFYMLVLLQWFTWTYMCMYMYIMWAIKIDVLIHFHDQFKLNSAVLLECVCTYWVRAFFFHVPV